MPNIVGNDQTISNDIDSTMTQFVPGTIHAEEVRDFWKTELKASEWVMTVLQEGYVIPFKETPPPYEEANNASAVQDMNFVCQTVEELRKRGVIQFDDQKPHCVSPLTVSKKISGDGSIKKILFRRIKMR